MKQNYLWRTIAAAMSEPHDATALSSLARLASPQSSAAVAAAVRLCRSARADERRIGVLLVDALLSARADLPEGNELRDVQAGARSRAETG